MRGGELERERIISLSEIHSLFKGYNWAKIEDYLEVNNTIGLTVTQTPSGLYIIEHQFKNKTVIVPTHKNMLINYGTTRLKDYNQDFVVALLWRFHGEPCETRSRSLGGETYKRK